jgi:hypothetical protein
MAAPPTDPDTCFNRCGCVEDDGSAYSIHGAVREIHCYRCRLVMWRVLAESRCITGIALLAHDKRVAVGRPARARPPGRAQQVEPAERPRSGGLGNWWTSAPPQAVRLIP